MRVVLDTNILLTSIPRNSKYRIIFDRFLLKQFTLVLSNEIVSEYAEIITEKTNTYIAANIIEMLLSAVNVERQNVFFN